MAKPRLAAIMERGLNENGFATARNQLVCALRKEWPIQCYDSGMKTAGNLLFSAFPLRSSTYDMELIAIETGHPRCRTGS
jgi:hypothetical protein